jgi:hypothetical protein
MATFGSDAMVIAGSSPYARRGVLWDAFRRWHGQADARNLVWRAPTRVMNPTVPQDFIDAEFERDPASAAAEYGAEFRGDIAEFVSMDVLDALSNVVIQILGKQNALYTVFTLNEARHLTPRRESSRIITQQAFSHSLHPLLKLKLGHLPKMQTVTAEQLRLCLASRLRSSGRLRGPELGRIAFALLAPKASGRAVRISRRWRPGGNR